MLRIGTRGSRLALWQANHVAERLRATGTPNVELVEIQTAGDQVCDVPLAQIGGEGVFTKEIQHALQEDRVDLAVHSLKDLRSCGRRIGPSRVPARAATGDCVSATLTRCRLVVARAASVAAQLLHRRSDLHLRHSRQRGNQVCNHDQGLDGVVLAQADWNGLAC